MAFPDNYNSDENRSVEILLGFVLKMDYLSLRIKV